MSGSLWQPAGTSGSAGLSDCECRLAALCVKVAALAQEVTRLRALVEQQRDYSHQYPETETSA